MPVEFKDEKVDKIVFSQAKLYIDGRKKLQQNEVYTGSSNLMVRLDIDYERAVETIRYYGYIDSLQKIGGLKSILTPLLSIMTPVFVLVFLLKLTKILK